MAVQHRVQTVLHAGDQVDMLAALLDNRAQVSYLLIRHPNAGQEAGRVQLRQNERGLLIVHHARLHDQGHVRRMHDGDRVDEGLQDVIHLPGVRRHFENDSVLAGQVLPGPGLHLTNRDAHRPEDGLLRVIDARRQQVLLVQVQADPAPGG
jgi:hypothetical protein